jgi:hypothetical protein
MKTLDKLAKFLEGVGSLICLYPANNGKRKIILSPFLHDDPLKKDWERVGLDMWEACQKAESQYLKSKQQGGGHDRAEGSSNYYR